MSSRDIPGTDEELTRNYGWSPQRIALRRQEQQQHEQDEAPDVPLSAVSTSEMPKVRKVRTRSKVRAQRQPEFDHPRANQDTAIQPGNIRELLDQRDRKATAIHPAIRQIFSGTRGGGDLASVLSNLVMFWFAPDKKGKIRARATVKGDDRQWVSMPNWRWAEIHGLAESSMRKVLKKLKALGLIDIHTVRGKHGVSVTIRQKQILACLPSPSEDAQTMSGEVHGPRSTK